MPHLSLYLPSFAADYSGVCSCLFDLNFLVVINDAACCTRNYIDYDEPRWSRTKTTALCSQLRTMDVIMGDEAKVIAKVSKAARELRPRGIALLGSPVTAITGMDMNGMACELEDETGIPSIGFATTGFSSYDRGIDLAHRGLLEKFCSFSNSRDVKSEVAAANACEGGSCAVNVLGMTPLDYGAKGTDKDVNMCLEQAGFTPGSSWCMGLTLESIAMTPSSAVNLVVSSGALRVAEDMEHRFGIPFVVGLPCAGHQSEIVIAALREAAAGGGSRYAFASPNDNACSNGKRGERMLIVGDWVCAASVRSAFRLAGWEGIIAIASFFGPLPRFAESGDTALSEDRQLAELLARGSFSVVVGDPLLERIPGVNGMNHVRLVHPAVSSNLFGEEVPGYVAEDVTQML